MLKALNVKLYPNSGQRNTLSRSFGCARKIYNLCLAESIRRYETDKKSMTSMADFTKYFFSEILKDEGMKYLHDENTKIMKGSLNNLSSAYSNFFRRIKEDKGKKGFPKFKRKDDKQSLNLEKLAFSKKVFDIPSKLFISKKYGFMRYMTSKENSEYLMNHRETVKNITIVKLKSGDYYARILIDSSECKKMEKSDCSIGIDLGIKNMAITSEGEIFENKHFHKNTEDKLKRLQRNVSNKKKGSRNRDKARVKLAKLSQHIMNCKKDYMNIISNKLINENQIICMEDLNVHGMMKNHHLAKSVQEMNFGEFRRIMEYKCKWYGRTLVFGKENYTAI